METSSWGGVKEAVTPAPGLEVNKGSLQRNLTKYSPILIMDLVEKYVI